MSSSSVNKSTEEHSLEWELIVALKESIKKLSVALIVVSTLLAGVTSALIWHLGNH